MGISLDEFDQLQDNLKKSKQLNKQQKKEKPVENRKIKNASKVDFYGNKLNSQEAKKIKQENGLIFDSEIERAFYQFLSRQKINFELKHKITIFPSFRLNGKGYQAVTWTPDFYLPDYRVIIDTKGYSNDSFPLRYRLILMQMSREEIPYARIWFVKTKSKFQIAYFLLSEIDKGNEIDDSSLLYHNVFKKSSKWKKKTAK